MPREGKRGRGRGGAAGAWSRTVHYQHGRESQRPRPTILHSVSIALLSLPPRPSTVSRRALGRWLLSSKRFQMMEGRGEGCQGRQLGRMPAQQQRLQLSVATALST